MNNLECLCTEKCASGFNPFCECTLEECNCQDVTNLIGEKKKETFEEIKKLINSQYDMEQTWNRVTKNWDYEYKFRKGGRTLCAFYVKPDKLGFMIIFGKAEREKFELERKSFSSTVCELYDESQTYHDGKWMMLELTDLSLKDDIEHLLHLKRRPNKK